MNKYKIGDIVQIRTDLKARKYYDGVYFAIGMNCIRGENVRIHHMHKEVSDKWYVIDVKNCGWIINDAMIIGKSNSKEVII